MDTHRVVGRIKIRSNYDAGSVRLITRMTRMCFTFNRSMSLWFDRLCDTL